MSENQQEKAIIELTAIINSIQLKLSELTLDLEVVKRNVAILSREVNTDDQKSSNNARSILVGKTRRLKREKEETIKTKVPSTSIIKEHVFAVEDRIKVLNPTGPKQTGLGTVTGYTRGGLVKFSLDNGVVTCRKSKNLILISKGSNQP